MGVSVAKDSGERGVPVRERIFVTVDDVSVVLVPSRRGFTPCGQEPGSTRSGETYDVTRPGDERCIYTYLFLGSKGGFSGNRLARMRGTAEVGWMSHGNRLHPAATPEEAAMKWLRWGRDRQSRTAKVRGRGAA